MSYSSDMAEEARVVRDVVAELNQCLPEGDRWALYDWAQVEEPWPASGTWQQFIPRASDPNVGVVICLFGERVGQPLPAYFPVPGDLPLPPWVRFPPLEDECDRVPLTGLLFELLDAVNANAVGSPAAVLCYVKADRTLFVRTDLAPEERGYGFEQYYDRLRAGEKRIRSRAQQADYDEQLVQLDRFCTEFFRKGSRPYVCFGTERTGPEGALDALRSRLRADLERVLRIPAATDDPRTLKGLAPFERADHDILFGRDRQIVRILDRLQSRARDAQRAFGTDVPVLVLTGRSGEGKSSLLRAGLLGRLERGRYFDYRPFDGVLVEGLRADAAAPLALLADSIDTALRTAGNAGLWRGLTLDALAPQARADALVAAVAVALAELPRDRSGRTRRLFVAVDQLDDILVAADDDTVRDGIAEMLAAIRDLARAGLAWSVIAASTVHLQRLIRLGPDLGSAIETLQPPGPEDLWDIVERSLGVAGYELPAHEIEAIVEQTQTWLIRQADAGPVLPLLGALLAEIVVERSKPWIRDPRDTTAPARSQLTLDGIVDRLADRALQRAYKERTGPADGVVPRLLRQLVNTAVSPGGQFPVIRPCADDHPAVRQAQGLVEALIAERLLYRPQPGMLRLIHVSTVEHWKLAAEWYAEDRRLQELIAHFEQRAERSIADRAAGSGDSLLTDWNDLGDALHLWSSWPDDPDRFPADFLRESLIAAYRPAAFGEHSRVRTCAYGLGRAIGTNDPGLIDAFLRRVEALPDDVRFRVVNYDEFNPVALHMAVWRGNADAVRRLISCGAALDVLDPNGRSPLYYAVELGSFALVELLVEHGALVDLAGSRARRPLLSSAARGSAREVSLLINCGADIEQPDDAGNTPLIYAANTGNAAAADVLLARGAAVDRPRTDGATPLYEAATNGSLAVVTALLSHGATMDLRGPRGATALIVAAWNGHRTVVRELVERGADIDGEAANGHTALMGAAEAGHADVVIDLLERGADIGHRGEHDWTALMYACMNGHVDVVRMLLAHGASLDDRSDEGAGALSLAAQQGHVAVIRELAARGLTIAYDQRHGSLAMQAAASSGQVGALRELLAAGGDPAYRREGVSAPLHLAAGSGHLAAMRTLLEYLAPIDQTQDQGATALAVAADAGELGAVRFLLSRGADVEHRDAGGRTALTIAAARGHRSVVSLLREHERL